MEEVYPTNLDIRFDNDALNIPSTPVQNKRKRIKRNNVQREKTAKTLDVVSVKAKRKNGKPKMSPEEYREMLQRKIESAVSTFSGRYVDFVNGPGLFVAGAELNGRYYYVWLDQDRRVQLTDNKEQYEYNKGFLEIIYDIPASLGILNYMRNHDRSYLLDIVNTFFDEMGYNRIGEINLGNEWPKSSFNPKRKFNGKNHHNNDNPKKKKKD